jgi:hypothetical protein
LKPAEVTVVTVHGGDAAGVTIEIEAALQVQNRAPS